MNSPVVTSIATLRASLNPPFFLCMTFIRLSSFAYSSQSFPQQSELPSFTRNISRLVYVCAKILSTHLAKYVSTL